MNEVSNLRDTIVPKSDQLNSEQLIGAPITITVTAVRRSTADDQPLAIHYKDDNGRPYKPCKSMRKVLIFAWGDDGNEWVGRSMTLYNNPDIKWGGVKVGGIRISHISHVQADLALSLTATKGKKEPVIIKRLQVAASTTTTKQADATPEIDTTATMAALTAAAKLGMDNLIVAWKATPPAIKFAINPKGCPQALKDIAEAADIATAAAIQAAADAEHAATAQQDPQQATEAADPAADDADYF